METPVPVPTALTTTFLPLGEQVMVVPLEAGHRIDQLIVQPDAHRDPPQTGLVIAIGPDVPFAVVTSWSRDFGERRALTRKEFVVKPGDLVLYGRYAGIGFTLPNGTPALLMRLTELLAVEAWETREGLNQALVEHETKTRGLVIHLETVACAHCPTPALDAERARFQAEQQAALAVEGWTCPGSTHGAVCDKPAGHDGRCSHEFAPATTEHSVDAWRRADAHVIIDGPASTETDRCGANLAGFSHPCERMIGHEGPHATWASDPSPGDRARWVWFDAQTAVPAPADQPAGIIAVDDGIAGL